MSAEELDPVQIMKRLIDEGKISRETLAKILSIDAGTLSEFLETYSGKDRGLTTITTTFPLSMDQASHLTMLSGYLGTGLDGTISDDERLKAIVETLILELHFTAENIALLTQSEVDDVERAFNDPSVLSAEKRYALGIRCSYLLNAVGAVRL